MLSPDMDVRIDLNSDTFVTIPSANVRFSGDAHGQAKLISHSQGYWYVIKNGDRTVTAIPDSTVGTVTISRP